MFDFLIFILFAQANLIAEECYTFLSQRLGSRPYFFGDE
jgi:hypothetical protein